MSDAHPADDHQSVARIEAAIRAAGEYVLPSDDLRPRTLEAAREHCEDQRATRRFGHMFIAAILLLALGSPFVDRLDDKLRVRTAPSANEMQRRALEHASHASIGPNWGMLEAFTELRRVQANRLSCK